MTRTALTESTPRSESAPPFPVPPRRDIAASRVARRVLRQAPLIVACALIAAVAAYVASSARTEKYEATAIIEVGSVDLISVFLSEAIQVEDADPARQAAASREIFNLPNVRDRAAESLGAGFDANEIGNAIRVEGSPDSSVLRVVATAANPVRAEQISNAMTEAFIEQRVDTARGTLVRAKRRVREQFRNLSDREKDSESGQELRQRLREVGVLGALSDGNVEIIQAARVPTAAVSPKPKRDALLGLFAGGLLGLGIALLRARLDDRITDAPELAELWDLPVVGVVPNSPALSRVGREVPDGAALEALSLARTNLRYLHVGGKVKTVLVTSALPSEGKSTIAVNLATAASMAGSRVLVIEADLRRPSIATSLGLTSRGQGLSEVLAGIATLEEALISVPLARDGGAAVKVDVLPAGLVPPSPVALLEGDATRAMLAALRSHYDIIFIDTPPATVVADALALIDEVDGVLVVSRLGTVRRGAYIRMRDTLVAIDAPILGQLVNSGTGVKGYGYYEESVATSKGTAKKTAATS